MSESGPGYLSRADLGGTTGHGPIVHEPEGVVFHHRWEASALALTLASGAAGKWNIDVSRRYRETLPNYLELSYYEIWTESLERMLVERGLITADELAAGHASVPPVEVAGVLTADRVAGAFARVRTRAGRVGHHTRLPGYVAGRVGTVERIHGVHVFPDTHAHDLGEQPHWLYNVVFDAGDLWADARPGQRVSVDAWEPYLTPAADGRP